jgi:hypothetical protein
MPKSPDEIEHYYAKQTAKLDKMIEQRRISKSDYNWLVEQLDRYSAFCYGRLCSQINE